MGCIWTFPWPKAAAVNDLYRPGGLRRRKSDGKLVGGARVLTDAARAWRDEVAIIVRQSGARPPADVDLGAVITLTPPADKRTHDVDGPIKPTLDAVFLALGENDRRVRWLLAVRNDPQGTGELAVRVEAYADLMNERG